MNEIQWFPGHMTKAVRQMQEDIRLIDLIIEVVDARVPSSSRNPEIDNLGRGKARLMILNKSDLADERANKAWEARFKEQGFLCVTLDARQRQGMKAVSAAIAEAGREKRERDLRRGIKNRPLRAMVAGIPNVGKSTFINTFCQKACTKTGNKPGVTKGKQWIRLDRNVELLDTPGILWPKFDSREVGERLAFIGSIRDEILSGDELCLKLIAFLREAYPAALTGRYQLETEGSELSILENIGRQRGCLKKGDLVDTEKAAAILLDDFRSGRLGRITLEAPL